MLNSEKLNSILMKISSIPANLSEDEFIRQTVKIIDEHLTPYFVGLFIVDPDKKVAVFRKGGGKIESQLMSRDWKIPLTDKNFWSVAVQLAEIRLNDWTKQEAFRCSLLSGNQPEFPLTLELSEEKFYSPLFPETRWQLLLPLQFKQQTIGILEIQSNDQAVDFNSEVIKNFLLLANQVAVRLK